MAHDNSVASQMEDWIVGKIQGIAEGGSPVFEESDVQPWDGTQAGSPNQMTEELFSGKRDLVVRVFYHSDRVIPLEEGAIRVVPRYVILLGMANRRTMGAARRGDGTAIGTNRLRDLMKAALHDKQPLDGADPLGDSATVIDRTYFRGSQVIMNMPNRCIQQSIVEVDESDKAV